jgi:hypothetical protein
MDTIESAQARLTAAYKVARRYSHDYSPRLPQHEKALQELEAASRNLARARTYHGLFGSETDAPEHVIRFGFTKMDTVFLGLHTASVQYFDRGPVGDTSNGWVYVAVPHGDISDAIVEIANVGGILL